MGAPKTTAMFFIFMISMLMTLPPLYACGYCEPPHPPYHRPKPPSHHRPHPPKTPKPHPPKSPKPPSTKPPVIIPPPIIMPPPVIIPPPIISPPIINPPVTIPPPSPTSQPTCPINALKLGLCVDLLGGLVHVGIGNPLENVCCPVLQGLLDLEAAICLCTTIRLKLLNLNIFIPLALQVLATCGLTPPPGFVCPPLL